MAGRWDLGQARKPSWAILGRDPGISEVRSETRICLRRRGSHQAEEPGRRGPARGLAPSPSPTQRPGASPRCLLGLGFQELGWPHPTDTLKECVHWWCPQISLWILLIGQGDLGGAKRKWLWEAGERDRCRGDHPHTGQSRQNSTQPTAV